MDKILFLVWMLGFPLVSVICKRILLTTIKGFEPESLRQYSPLETIVWLVVGYQLWHL